MGLGGPAWLEDQQQLATPLLVLESFRSVLERSRQVFVGLGKTVLDMLPGLAGTVLHDAIPSVDRLLGHDRMISDDFLRVFRQVRLNQC